MLRHGFIRQGKVRIFYHSKGFIFEREGFSFIADEVRPSSQGWDKKPVYSDDNISFFALPLFPSDDSISPLSPSKRKRDELESVDAEGSSAKSVRLSAANKRSNPYATEEFNPAKLQGKEAEEWLDFLISKMFRTRIPVIGALDMLSDPNTQWAEEVSKYEANFDLKQFHLPLPMHTNFAYSLCYLGVAKRIRGKFDNNKAAVLHIPKGPIRSRLTNGETVVLEDGRQITPDMCVSPPDRSAVGYLCFCARS